jgi:hypothetical protein
MHDLNDTLLTVSSALLLAFAALSAVDGVYIHLVRLRLHARPASWTEHVWHTGRALLFAPILLSLFTHVTGGALLWAGVALLVVDQALELLDTTSENQSRASLGGLGTFEYVLHILLTTLRTAAIAVGLAARPAAAWSLSAPHVLRELPGFWSVAVLQLVPGAMLIALVHVVLAVRHRRLCGCFA